MTSDALWAIVPVKPLGEGKSRLAPLLTRDERAVLSEGLLRRTLAAAMQSERIAGLIVVSRDPAVWEIAEAAGAIALAEEGVGLNPALEQARAVAIESGAESIAVFPADLPGITGEALDEVIGEGVSEAIDGATVGAGALTGAGCGILIVPSVTGGTNLLIVRPAAALPFSYGVESCARHAALARARGLDVRIFSSPILALDVDLPGDLDPALLAAYVPGDPPGHVQASEVNGAVPSPLPESHCSTG